MWLFYELYTRVLGYGDLFFGKIKNALKSISSIIIVIVTIFITMFKGVITMFFLEYTAK